MVKSSDSASERATIARLADELVPTLIARLAKSELGELEVRENDWRIRLRRPSAGDAAGGVVAPTQHAAHKPTTGSHTAAAQAARRDPRGLVTSPAVGYFAPRDGVVVGSKLRAGDSIGSVDVLGVRQDVLSPVDGIVRVIEVQSGQAVEYGQPIGRVEANG